MNLTELKRLFLKRKEQCPYFIRNTKSTSKITCFIPKTPELVSEHCKNKKNQCVYLSIYGYAKEGEC